jgi:WXG100 family type VII secretion target
MANITLDYESMRSEATALRNSEEQIKSELTALKGRVTNLVSSGFVTERSSGAFDQRVDDFKRASDATISALSDLASQLEQIVQTFADTDTATAV